MNIKLTTLKKTRAGFIQAIYFEISFKSIQLSEIADITC